jgi:hypothetical protein
MRESRCVLKLPKIGLIDLPLAFLIRIWKGPLRLQGVLRYFYSWSYQATKRDRKIEKERVIMGSAVITEKKGMSLLSG